MIHLARFCVIHNIRFHVWKASDWRLTTSSNHAVVIHRYYMEKNDEMKEKIESRYVDGVGGIRAAPKIEEMAEKKDKKNFGGKGQGPSGRTAKGVKNAKRMTM